jgi:hypothetical protein
MRTMRNKGMLLVAAAAIWLSVTAAATATASEGRYTDTSGHWAEATVNRMSTLGILDGFPDGTFRPQEPVTADQFVKMLLLSFSEQYPNGERGWKNGFVESLTEANRSVLQRDYRSFSFKPAAAGYWAKPYVELAEDLNILAVNQFADYKAKLKREEVAEIIYYAVKETEYLEDSKYSTPVAERYGDYLSLTPRTRKFVAEASAKGIMEGYPNGYFGVGLPVTRAEALSILERLTEKKGRIAVKPDDSQAGFIKMVPTADGSYRRLVFPSARMLEAYDVMQEAAKLRGTNYDMEGTVLRLFKDAPVKAKALDPNTAKSAEWDEASLWLEPGYKTYGVTIRYQEGMLARNEEAIRTFTDYIFGYHAATFQDLFQQVYTQLAEGTAVENKTVAIGGFSVEVEVQPGSGTAVFSILETD